MACIRSIHEQTRKVNYEIIVVDNASYDGCGERLAREYSDVVFVQNQANTGFGSANNLGASRAHGPVLLFLNPDTEVGDRALDRLYDKLLTLPDAGVIGGRLLNSDRSLQTSCVQPLPTILNQLLDVDFLQRVFRRVGVWGTAVRLDANRAPVEIEAISGACMMIRREVFELVGGFTADYFMYTEDLDLCYKVRQAGFRNYHVPEAVIVHHGGGSSRQARSDFSNVMVRDSVGRFLRKSRGGLYSACYRWAMSGVALIRLGLLVALFPVWMVRREIRAWYAAFGKWFSILRWGLGLTPWTRQYAEVTAQDRSSECAVGPVSSRLECSHETRPCCRP